MKLANIIRAIKDRANFICVPFGQISYSQEGEDMVLRRMLPMDRSGFYIDVGAYHPFRYSNTYYFYTQGWRGINIDANPDSMKLFNLKRPNDINLEIPIASRPQKLTYYRFNQPAFNGFKKDLSEIRSSEPNIKITEKLSLKTMRLDQILDAHLPVGQNIDFLSVDVEGMDLDVLKSNNWKKYRPKIILVEELSETKLGVGAFLSEHGYSMVAKTLHTVLFRHKDL